MKVENKPDCTTCSVMCLSGNCIFKQKFHICDKCKKQKSRYESKGKEYCEDCFSEYLISLFSELSLYDKIELMKHDYVCYEDVYE